MRDNLPLIVLTIVLAGVIAFHLQQPRTSPGRSGHRKLGPPESTVI